MLTKVSQEKIWSWRCSTTDVPVNNQKTAVITKWSKKTPGFHTRLSGLAAHDGFAQKSCQPYRAVCRKSKLESSFTRGFERGSVPELRRALNHQRCFTSSTILAGQSVGMEVCYSRAHDLSVGDRHIFSLQWPLPSDPWEPTEGFDPIDESSWKGNAWFLLNRNRLSLCKSRHYLTDLTWSEKDRRCVCIERLENDQIIVERRMILNLWGAS